MKFGVVSDLLSDVSLEKKSGVQEIVWIPRGQIRKNKRNGYAIGDIDGLAADIKHGGLAQPLEVYQTKDGMYELLTGERRLTAIDQLIADGDWNADIPCLVRELSDYKVNLSDEAKELYAIIRTNRFNRTKTDSDLLFEAMELKKIVEELRKNGEKELWFGEELSGGIELSGRTREIVGKALDISNGQVAKIEAITKNGILEVLEAIREQRMSIAAAYLLSMIEKTEQEAFMALHTTGKIETSSVRNYIESIQNKKQKQSQIAGQSPDHAEGMSAPAAENEVQEETKVMLEGETQEITEAEVEVKPEKTKLKQEEKTRENIESRKDTWPLILKGIPKFNVIAINDVLYSKEKELEEILALEGLPGRMVMEAQMVVAGLRLLKELLEKQEG